MQKIELDVNGRIFQLLADPQTPLLYVLRGDLGLKGPKYGCGSEQCGACKVLIDGAAVPSCQLPVEKAQGLKIITVEGMGTAGALHPLQEAFIAEQAIQCGYCAAGMIIAAQGLLNRTRYPTDEDIRTALEGNLCRCGVYDRVRRAIKRRVGRPQEEPIYEVIDRPDGQDLKPDDLPESLRHYPELDRWIRINEAETITIFTGKVEIGQGIKTAAAQIAADILGVALERIEVVDADTGRTPDEGLTSGSMSLQTTGNALRYAAAEARAVLLAMAFEELEALTAPEDLLVEDGLISDPLSGRQISYWQLFGGRLFHRRMTGVGQRSLVRTGWVLGQPARRIDLPAKVSGGPSFVPDLELPGMVHGRVLRPPTYAAVLVSLDEEAARRLPGVLEVVRDGRFLGVIAEKEDQAVRALEALRQSAVWQGEEGTLTGKDIAAHLFSAEAQSFWVREGTAVRDPIPAPRQPGQDEWTLEATYFRPYQMHGSLGPSAAVAHFHDGQLTVWSHSQGVFLLRDGLAQVLELNPDQVRVIHRDGSGCYGHNGADDVALDAALLARALPGRPLALQWMRADEHTWEPYGPAMVIKLSAGLDRSGHVAGWNQDIWSYPHVSRSRPDGQTTGLLAAWHRERPWPKQPARVIYGRHFGSYRNADPLYAFPNKRTVAHLVTDSPLRTSALRSLGAYANVFAIESFLDELALLAGVDPLAFRLRHLQDERARDVLTAAAQKAGWQPRPRPACTGLGRGMAFARYKNAQCYCAVIVDLAVDLQNSRVQLGQVTIAADAGEIVNPDGLSNQLEGGFVQAASWTLLEEVTFSGPEISSRDWDSYPILRFNDAPPVKTVLINRPDRPFLGSGEASQGPTGAAIANAVFDAVGVRVRSLPITPQKIRAALR